MEEIEAVKTPDELKALYEEGAGALDMEDLTPLFDEIKTLRARVEELSDYPDTAPKEEKP